MDKKTVKILKLIKVIFLVWVIGVMLCEKGHNRIILVGLVLLLCASIFIFNKLLYKNKLNDEMKIVKLFIYSALVYWIMLIDKTNVAEVLFFIIIGDAIILYSMIHGLIFTIISLISYVIISYIKLGYPSFSSFSSHILNYILNFAFVYGFMFIAKYQIVQREILNKTTQELAIKTKNLEKAYKKIHESFDTKAQVAILEERNRIAGEIHDTVGHTLTTVLIEIEAGKRLMKKDMDLSVEKLDLAQEQVRKGLNDIRKSVRTLKEGGTVLEFVPSIKALIHETEKHGGVNVEYSISEIPYLNKDIEKSLYRALQEGLTNGIRHGKSSKFNFSLEYINGNIVFKLKDNGCGCEDIEFGFGFSNMKFRIDQLGGSLKIKSKLQEGCTILIEIPVDKENE